MILVGIVQPRTGVILSHSWRQCKTESLNPRGCEEQGKGLITNKNRKIDELHNDQKQVCMSICTCVCVCMFVCAYVPMYV